MPTTAAILDTVTGSTRIPAKTLRTIALATDGSPGCDAAVTFTRALAARGSVGVHVVSVCEPTRTLDLSPFGVVLAPSVEMNAPLPARDRRLEAVRAQLTRTIGADVTWPTHVAAGATGAGLAALAKDANADLLVLGRERHGTIDRMLGEDHLLNVIRASSVPVMTIEPTLVRAPKRCAIAIDFSTGTLELLSAALMVVDESATIYLVHVNTDGPFAALSHPSAWLKTREHGTRTALQNLRARLLTAPGVNVESVVLEGHLLPALKDFVLQSDIDLIAMGTHGHGFVDRLVIGSATERVLRDIPCSTLVVPPPVAA